MKHNGKWRNSSTSKPFTLTQRYNEELGEKVTKNSRLHPFMLIIEQYK